MKLISIVATTENNVIGIGNKMPWHLPDDLKFFKKITSGSPIIMGKNTWFSLGAKPLPNRINIVISKTLAPEASQGAEVFGSLDEVLAWLGQHPSMTSKAFIIGGGQLYKSTMNIIDEMYITRVHTEIENGEVFFPEFDRQDWIKSDCTFHDKDEKHIYSFTFNHWIRK